MARMAGWLAGWLAGMASNRLNNPMSIAARGMLFGFLTVCICLFDVDVDVDANIHRPMDAVVNRRRIFPTTTENENPVSPFPHLPARRQLLPMIAGSAVPSRFRCSASQ